MRRTILDSIRHGTARYLYEPRTHPNSEPACLAHSHAIYVIRHDGVARIPLQGKELFYAQVRPHHIIQQYHTTFSIGKEREWLHDMHVNIRVDFTPWTT